MSTHEHDDHDREHRAIPLVDSEAGLITYAVTFAVDELRSVDGCLAAYVAGRMVAVIRDHLGAGDVTLTSVHTFDPYSGRRIYGTV